MQIPLSPGGEQLLRDALARHPGQSPTQIVERLLTEQARRERPPRSGTKLTVESFHAWLDQFTVYSERIPSMPGETFSREMIYQDHD
jgi:hypothetical protein